jgi:hypothetical protein
MLFSYRFSSLLLFFDEYRFKLCTAVVVSTSAAGQSYDPSIHLDSLAPYAGRTENYKTTVSYWTMNAFQVILTIIVPSRMLPLSNYCWDASGNRRADTARLVDHWGTASGIIRTSVIAKILCRYDKRRLVFLLNS